MSQTLQTVELDDKYALGGGTVLLNGRQALVRALLLQREADRRAGLNTAGYVSGYRGSPLGGLDQELWSARATLEAQQVVFAPGVNEDLAATAVWGTQQLAAIGDATVDGVFALWYGKGPGVDRSGDPLKHGNYSGSHPRGGVLVVCGDDHPGKSSTVAHHSQQALAAHGIPTLYPADVGEYAWLALLGWAMSRYSGCWVGYKVVNETIEQSMTVDFDLDRFAIERPDPGPLPAEGLHYRGVYAPVQEEANLRRYKLPLVQRFARANRIDRVMIGAPGARLGIVAAGKCWHDTRLALRALGIDEARAAALGIAVYKIGLLWPLEPLGLTEFAAGKDELLFVEEKTAFVEAQAASLLYNLPQRPRITGKTDGAGQALLPSDLGFEAVELAFVIAGRLQALGLADEAVHERVQALRSGQRAIGAVTALAEVRRIPYFCSGCPHNTSTQLPEGSKALSGIGCSGMAMWGRKDTLMPTQMGGEGLNWVGAHRFTARKHIFQNLGDGTYFHSGLLAIRAAVASGANVTYKILYNDAVAMTGGQPIDGPLTPAAVAHQVRHEGVQHIVLVSDDPGRHRASALPAGVRIEHRDRLDAVQRELRDTPGCTVLLYEQTCAAEKRRRRKRGEFPDPDRRVFIHDAVCEGCGDCSQRSGCVSVEAVDTPLGRKRRINQSSCNKDFSCVNGFCPSFVSVLGGKPKKAAAVQAPEALFAALPAPLLAPLGTQAYGVSIPGVGGTGVITVGAVLAMAAHLEGKAAATYDMTGLAQKNGAVYSHLQVAARTADLRANRLGQGEADLVLAFDMIAALGDEALRIVDPERSRWVGNLRVQPTAALAMGIDQRVDFALLARKVGDRLPPERVAYVDATGIATALLGDAMASNFFLVGVALQRGWLPVSLAAVERAIELNRVQVEFNRRALNFGRLWVHDAATVARLLGDALPAAPQAEAPVSLDAVAQARVRQLVDYQDAAYAARYVRLLERVREAERRVAGGDGALSQAVAIQFARLLAFKDEYEVARLYASAEFRNKLEATFDGITGVRLHMAPPLFARRDRQTGHLIKGEYGAWMLMAMAWLARLRKLRGTALDIFGRTAERRAERALIDDYERRIGALLAELDAARLPLAVQIAETADLVRGFGHVKARQMALAHAAWDRLDAQWRGQPVAMPAPLVRAA